MISSTPRPHFTPGKEPVPILQEAGWAPGPVCAGGKSCPYRDSIPHRPARISVAIPTVLPGPPIFFEWLHETKIKWLHFVFGMWWGTENGNTVFRGFIHRHLNVSCVNNDHQQSARQDRLPKSFEVKEMIEPFGKYRVIRNDCSGFNNLSYTIHLR